MVFMVAPKSAGDGTSFLPILSYNAKAGRMFLVNRDQQPDGSWDTNKVDVTMTQPAFAIDFGRLETGWVHFAANAAPQWHMAPLGQPQPPKPPSPGNDDKGKALQFRNGFRLPVAGNAIGGIREFSGNSSAMITGMNELHTTFEAAPEAAAGKIPVVKMMNVIEVKAGQSINFQPVFVIQAWVDRPESLGPRTVPPPASTGRAAPVATAPAAPPPAQQITPPASAAAPAAKMPF